MVSDMGLVYSEMWTEGCIFWRDMWSKQKPDKDARVPHKGGPLLLLLFIAFI